MASGELTVLHDADAAQSADGSGEWVCDLGIR